MTLKAPKIASQPIVYSAVKPVGILRPKFNPNATNKFDISIDVIGTAFWLKNEKCLITCAHVITSLLGSTIEQTGILYVGISNGQFLQASISSIDYLHDLAVLRLHGDNQVIETEIATGLEICTEYLPVGGKIGYSGYPGGNILFVGGNAEPTYAEGVIGNQIRDQGLRKDIQITGTVFGGFSGGPIVSIETNQLIGVVSNSPRADMGQAGIFMGISFEHVKAIADLQNS